MANNPRQDLYLEISQNLEERELTDLRNYVSGAKILPGGFVPKANAHQIFNQLEKEQKLKPGDLTLLADLLRKIGRHDYAEQAEKIAENERKEPGKPDVSAKIQKEEELSKPNVPAKRSREEELSKPNVPAKRPREEEISERNVPAKRTRVKDAFETLKHLLTEVRVEDDSRADTYNRLARHVAESGLTFRAEVPKDGNCMFHSVSDQLFRTKAQRINHEQLRNQAVDFLRDRPYNGNGDHLRAFVPDENWERYLSVMSRDGTWGDHIVLQAMADMFGHDISIVSSVEGENYVTILTPTPGTVAPEEPPLLLGHYAENHYASLDVGEDQEEETAHGMTEEDTLRMLQEEIRLHLKEDVLKFPAGVKRGELVKVLNDERKVTKLQEGHGGYNPEMKASIGKTGRVLKVRKHQVKVEINYKSWWFNPEALTPVLQGSREEVVAAFQLKVGDQVKVGIDVETFKTNQAGHGGYVSKMAELVEQVGVVHQIDIDGDVIVYYPNGTRWCINPLSLSKLAPEECGVVDVSGIMEVGDWVKVESDKKTIKRVQERTVPWDEGYYNAAGKVGQVRTTYTSNKTMRVRIKHAGYPLNISLLTKATAQDIHKAFGSGDVPTSDVARGDLVKISVSLDQLKRMQDGHGGFVDRMEEVIGTVGSVSYIDRDGDVFVRFSLLRLCFNPAALLRVSPVKDTFYVGDIVLIESDKDRLTRLQTDEHGGYNSRMLSTCGKTGRLHSLISQKKIRVKVQGKVWVFNPDLLTKMGNPGLGTGDWRSATICAPGQHDWSRGRCLVCVKCGECTHYGTFCPARGKPGRYPGSLCGCGNGEAGCDDCGYCRRCAGEIHLIDRDDEPDDEPDDVLQKLQQLRADFMDLLGNISSAGSASVPTELEMAGPELRVLYDRACAEGYIEVYNTRFVLIGKFANGKTNLCHSLLGEEFDPEWKITDGIEIHPCVMTQNQHWRKLKGQEDHFPHTVAEVMKKLKDKKKEDETGPKSPTTSPRDSDVTDRTEAVTTMGTKNKREERPKPPTSTEDSQPDLDVLNTTAPDVQATTPQQAQIDKTPPKTFIKAADIFRKQKGSEDQSNVTGTKEYPLISIWDFGGQEIFYSTQQVFYTHRAIYGMVLDLTKPLDSPVEEMSTVGPTSHCRKEKDFIDYHLESIRAHTRPPVPRGETGQTPAATDTEPPVLLIFTKKDQYPEESKQETFHSDTRIHLEGKVIDEHVNDRYFSVDNTKRNPEDPEVTELRTFILDMARKQSYMGERIPVKWLELKSKLQDMHKQGKRYCTLQKVIEAIGSPPVKTTPEENAISILKFWHLCGDIIYFPVQNLRNFVILDPQWFVDVCKTIITIPQYRDPKVKKDWDKLKKTGELRDDLIKHVWKKKGEALRYNLIDHKQELLDMMEKFDLVLRCHGRSDEERGPKCVAAEMATYFVPSLLTTVTDEKKLYPPGTTRSKPIFIVFDGQFCPVGLYHRMVIGSMRRYFNIKPLAYASCARFITDNLRQTFVITKEKFFLKIELVSSVRDEAIRFSHGPNVREGLEEDLREIIDNWAPGIKYNWCLKCSCIGHKEKEDISVDEDIPIDDASAIGYFKSGDLVCKTYAPATMTVQDVGLADWFRNPLPQAGDEMLYAHPGGQPSVLQNCFHIVVKEVCPQWRELGFRLKLSSANVDEIEERHRGDPKKCCRAVCDRWVQLNGSQATVDVLKDALISIREVRTAEHIDDYLQQMSQGQPTQVQLQTGQGRGSVDGWFAVIVEDVCPRWTELSRHLGLTEAQVDEIADKHSGDPRECCWEALKLWSRIQGRHAFKERLRAALISAEEIATVEKLDTLAQ